MANAIAIGVGDGEVGVVDVGLREGGVLGGNCVGLDIDGVNVSVEIADAFSGSELRCVRVVCWLRERQGGISADVNGGAETCGRNSVERARTINVLALERHDSRILVRPIVEATKLVGCWLVLDKSKVLEPSDLAIVSILLGVAGRDVELVLVEMTAGCDSVVLADVLAKGSVNTGRRGSW